MAVLSKLNSRLKTAADMVRKGSVAADVGTDHGYLACYLVSQGICPNVFAGDINKLPLEKARMAVKRRKLDDKVTLILSDGLKEFPENCAQDIIIAGMGGELIWQIINGVSWLRDKNIRLILQPMTRDAELRKSLMQNGFYIIDEQAVRDKGRLYTVMLVCYKGERFIPDDFACTAGKHLETCKTSPLSAAYLKRQAAILEKKAAGLSASADVRDTAEAKSVLKTIESIQKAIKED